MIEIITDFNECDFNEWEFSNYGDDLEVNELDTEEDYYLQERVLKEDSELNETYWNLIFKSL